MPRLTTKQVERIEERLEKKKKEHLKQLQKELKDIPERLKENWRV